MPWGTSLTSAHPMSHQLLLHPPAWADLLSDLWSPELYEMSTLRSQNSSGDATELELPSTAQSGELVTLADQQGWTGSSGGG